MEEVDVVEVVGVVGQLVVADSDTHGVRDADTHGKQREREREREEFWVNQRRPPTHPWRCPLPPFLLHPRAAPLHRPIRRPAPPRRPLSLPRERPFETRSRLSSSLSLSLSLRGSLAAASGCDWGRRFSRRGPPVVAGGGGGRVLGVVVVVPGGGWSGFGFLKSITTTIEVYRFSLAFSGAVERIWISQVQRRRGEKVLEFIVGTERGKRWWVKLETTWERQNRAYPKIQFAVSPVAADAKTSTFSPSCCSWLFECYG